MFAWVAYLGGVSFNLAINAQLSILEGIGLVVPASVARLTQSLVYVCVLFVFANSGFGVASAAIAMVASVGAELAIAYLVFRKAMVWRRRGAESVLKVRWLEDVLQFQWRIAVSWCAGYVVFQGQVALLFDTSGPLVAGQFGLTNQILLAMTTLASVMLTARIKHWTAYAIRNERRELRQEAIHTVLTTTLLVWLGAIIFTMALSYLASRNSSYVQRFLPPTQVFWLGLGSAFNQVFFALNYFFRAQAKEPLWACAIFSAISMIAIDAYYMHSRSSDVVVFGYCGVCIFWHGVAPLVVFLRQQGSTHTG